MKAHGGFIRVRSEHGEGSLFEVYLPAAARAPMADERLRTQPRFGQGEMVLVVDDEESIRVSLTRLLGFLGLQTLTACGGLEALSLLERHRGEVRVILTDINMPMMDGVSLVRELHRLGQGIPIIAMTGLHAEERQNQLREMGVTLHVSKPFTVSDIAEVLRQALVSVA